MKIALVTPEFVTEDNYDGGLANYLDRISYSLVSLGHEVHVLVESNRDECFERDGVRVHRIDVLSIFIDQLLGRVLGRLASAVVIPWRSFRLNRKLLGLHREAAFDLVQYPSYRALALFRPRAIPALIRLSSLQSLWSRAYADRMSSRLATRVESWLESRALLRADRLISPSRLVADAAARLIHRAVDVVESPFIPVRIEENRGKVDESIAGHRYALFFGTIGLLKGVKTIAEMLGSLFEMHPELYFVFVGKEEHYEGRPMMEFVLACAGAYRDRVIRLERMRHDALYPVIEAAAVVVLPSRIDNFPNACLEAMAHGKIVVGTRGASFEQLIEDGESGFLCEIDDPTSLLRAVDAALTLDAPEAMERRARARIDCLRPELAGARLLEIYREVTREKGPQSRVSGVL